MKRIISEKTIITIVGVIALIVIFIFQGCSRTQYVPAPTEDVVVKGDAEDLVEDFKALHN